jgi:hypothetical protein
MTVDSSIVGASLPDLSQMVLRRARVRLHRLAGELDILRRAYSEREDLPGLRTLVDAMALVTAEAERQVLHEARLLYERIASGANTEREQERFRGQVGGLLNAVERALPSPMALARRAHGREVEALIAPFSRMISQLMRKTSVHLELIFEPSDDYGFQLSVIEELQPVARQLSDDLRDQLDDLPQLTVIAYPQQLEAETLLHAVMAHEAAHVAVHPGSELGKSASDAFDEAVQQHWLALVAAMIAEIGGPEEDAIEEARIRTERMKRWFIELLCDALAVALVGPAYPLALADLDVASDRWAQLRGVAGHDSHPGLAWRLERAISLAQRMYLHGQSQGDAWEALRSALAKISASLPDERDEITDVERDMVQDALEAIDPQDAVGPSAFYPPETLRADLPLVWEKLASRIPPAERIDRRTLTLTDTSGQRPPRIALDGGERWSSPIAVASILTGAYAWWHAERAASAEAPGAHRNLPDSPSALEDWLAFNGFIRGTIELRGLHERMSEDRERLDGLNAPQLADHALW